MARTAITAASIRQLTAQHTTVGVGDAEILTEAGDDVNGNDIPCTGSELLVVVNPGASPYTVAITAAPDEIGRAGSISAYSVPAGENHIFGPFPTNGWKQTDGMLYVDVSDATLEIGILKV